MSGRDKMIINHVVCAMRKESEFTPLEWNEDMEYWELFAALELDDDEEQTIDEAQRIAEAWGDVLKVAQATLAAEGIEVETCTEIEHCFDGHLWVVAWIR